jgi:ribosome maturation factor RimP
LARVTPQTLERIRTAAEELAVVQGLSVERVEYVREAGTWYLRVTVNRPEGITMSDCEALHRPLSKRLDQMDPIATPYFLEVSSPGIGAAHDVDADTQSGGGTE